MISRRNVRIEAVGKASLVGQDLGGTGRSTLADWVCFRAFSGPPPRFQHHHHDDDEGDDDDDVQQLLAIMLLLLRL